MSHQFKATVWIHQNYQTGEPLAVELTTISGECIQMDFIRYMDAHAEDIYVIGRFNRLKAETAYNIIGCYWYCDNEYDLQIDAYVEIVVDEDELHAMIDGAADYAMAMTYAVPF